MLLQRKNDSRDASARSSSRYGRVGAQVRRVGFEAEQEFRAREDELKRRFDAAIELLPVRSAAALIEVHQRARRSARVDRPAIGAPASVERICVRAASSSLPVADATPSRGWQTKILRRDGVSPDPVVLERTFDRQAVDRRIAHDVEAVDGGPQERLDQVVA